MFAEIDLTFSILKLNQMQLSNEELIDLLITKYLNTGIVLFFTLATVYCMFHRTIVRVIYITSFCVFFSFSMWMLIDEKAILKSRNIFNSDFFNAIIGINFFIISSFFAK